MPDGVNNVPERERTRAALLRMRRDIDTLLGASAGLPVRNTAPPAGSKINAWISWVDGKLYWRSPDGFVQSVGTAGHGGTGAVSGSITYETAQILVDPVEAKVYPARPDAHLEYGQGVQSLIRFNMPALTPVAAEIIEVEIRLSHLEGDAPLGEHEVYIGGTLIGGALPGSFATVINPINYVVLPHTGTAWSNLSREVGENLRDDVWDTLVITEHKHNPELWGLLAGLSDSSAAPQLRITYASET